MDAVSEAQPQKPTMARPRQVCPFGRPRKHAPLFASASYRIRYGPEELKDFRQWGSSTPGHPEYDPKRGIETTTGPLGQGFANGVGMAIAQKYLESRYNRDGFPLFDYRVYAIVSDGDMMEGVSNEAASLAGHLSLLIL